MQSHFNQSQLLNVPYHGYRVSTAAMFIFIQNSKFIYFMSSTLFNIWHEHYKINIVTEFSSFSFFNTPYFLHLQTWKAKIHTCTLVLAYKIHVLWRLEDAKGITIHVRATQGEQCHMHAHDHAKLHLINFDQICIMLFTICQPQNAKYLPC